MFKLIYFTKGVSIYLLSCIKISDTKICPNCNASILIKNEITANRKTTILLKNMYETM